MLQVFGNSLPLSLHSANHTPLSTLLRCSLTSETTKRRYCWNAIQLIVWQPQLTRPVCGQYQFQRTFASSVISARGRPVNYFWYDKPFTATDAKPHRCLTHNPRKCTQDRTTAYNLIRTLMLPKIFPVVFSILMCTAKRDTPATVLQYRHSSQQHCGILLHV